ncbi:N-acylmannosamine kinase [Aliiruegeria haliotis]|uniref:N-acylmannosamine kinase n=1 Tax=Aliiruegeria haliotis TaxID=1280846 RepID=A0A2T0RM14_9RHOB|nr:ROK family protein [Aliiruegeria haliotis]PRY22177.1 N-acylmannosamine kinase [Aliiruegeria haliotis]
MTVLSRSALSGVALDLGGTKLAAARIERGDIVARAQVPTRGAASTADQVADMQDLARNVGLETSDPIAMAVAGRVDAGGIWRAVNSETLSNLSDVNLRTLGSDVFDRQVSVINDAQAAALAEYHFGAGQGSDAMAYVTVSTGVGGGFVIGGMPLRSANGLSGHIGFSTSRLASQRCGCGRLGTVESIAAGRAISAEANRRGHRVKDAREVFEHWRAGADWAADIINTSAAAVAEMCANLTATLGIDRVVLGGGIGLAEGYAQRVSHYLGTEPSLFRPYVVPARLGADGVLLGALAAMDWSTETR